MGNILVVDIYNYFLKNPHFNKLLGPDYLFVEFTCPINVSEFQFFADTHMLNYVISGRKDWISSDKTYEIKGGDALFVKKGVYTTRQYFDADYCVMLFFISDEFIRKFLSENPGLRFPEGDEEVPEQIFVIDVNEALQALFYTVFNYFKLGGELPRELVEIKFKELLFTLILNPRNRRLAKFLYSRQQVVRSDLEFVMEKYFQHQLSMEDFARLSGRSLSSFKRDFKNHFNETPGRWLIRKRLQHALSLLMVSELDVNQICYESGFQNASHFNRVFKEVYEITPRQFRIQQASSKAELVKQV